MKRTRDRWIISSTSYILLLGLLISLVTAVNASTNSTYEVLIQKGNDSCIEVDHIVIWGGTDEEIGYEIGRIGIDEFNAILIPFDDPIYGKAKEEYIRLHDPVMYERIIGIKRAYGLDRDDYSFDPSLLFYMLISSLCSAVYLPPSSTEDGHAIGGKNLEWNIDFESDALVDIAAGNYEGFLSERIRDCICVVEIYPDDGYATLAIGGLDLENGVFDGINEMGLAVSALQDGDTYTDPITSLAGGTTSGLNFLQMLRSILENCATVEEAKLRILTNRISMPFIGQHFLVYDRSGNATVIEFDNTSREAIFTDFSNAPVPMTNYAVHLRPDWTILVPENPLDPHDDFLRMRKLHGYIDAHAGPFNETDVWAMMALVEANANASAEGVLTKGTIRVVYSVVSDLDELTMTARFYLRDGPVRDPVMGTNELIFSEPFTFRLER